MSWVDPSDPAAVRAYNERQANNRHGFLKTGAKPEVIPTVLHLEFGQWETPEGMEADDDLKILHSIHHMARQSFDEMLETIDQVAGDDDPSLNHDGRLKIAARIIEPKVGSLAKLAERELGKVDAKVESLEADIGKALRTADPVDVAVHADIRAHLRSLDLGKRTAALREAIEKGDITTLQAITTAPPYLSGFDLKGGQDGATRLFNDAMEAAKQRLAPEQHKRVQALRQGKARTLQALSTFHKKANGLIDFNRAKQLTDLEAARRAKYEE
ncbi:hypothetical protein [Pseudoxanthomonas japonensis]|uniref:hypothetical protein n=1 Tax=Pseudoxanthomonas japonensis TaxID=69284 RepID=UPI001BCE463F|nr:hypothetical protein [Pseudoxanthomonas japonensis]